MMRLVSPMRERHSARKSRGRRAHTAGIVFRYPTCGYCRTARRAGRASAPCTRDCIRSARPRGPLWVNDTHSALNRTPVAPGARAALAWPRWPRRCAGAARRGEPLAIAGARHAMGGQQFLSGGTLLDTRRLNQVRWFDRGAALLEVEAGITWPDVIRGYLALQRGPGPAYGIRQKQTGADRLTLGGAVAANIHGRGLDGPPFVDDIEGLEVVTADRRPRALQPRAKTPSCSGTWSAATDLFGVVTAVTLRLVPRVKVERVVARLDIEELIDAFDERIAARSPVRRFPVRHRAAIPPISCAPACCPATGPSRPTAACPTDQRRLSQRDWNELLTLSHTRQARGVPEVHRVLPRHARPALLERHAPAEPVPRGLSRRARPSAGRRGARQRDDHRAVRAARAAGGVHERRAPRLPHERRRLHLRHHPPDRGRDTTRALPWARDSWACVIFNLHIDHRPEDIARAAAHFRRLIDHALRHRRQLLPHLSPLRAPRDQLRAAHPGMRRVPRGQAPPRSGRSVPERLVPRLAGAARVKHRMTRAAARSRAAVELHRAVRRARHRPVRGAGRRAAWLPDMDAWYSGLLPYYLLLPAQIALLMIMAVVAWNRRVRTGALRRARTRASPARCACFAGLYFVVMARAARRQRDRQRRRLLARTARSPWRSTGCWRCSCWSAAAADSAVRAAGASRAPAGGR